MLAALNATGRRRAFRRRRTSGHGPGRNARAGAGAVNEMSRPLPTRGATGSFLPRQGRPFAGRAGAMLHLRLDGPIARLLLDRPEARNAIPVETWPDIARLAKEAARDGARVLILSGSDQAFSAGADLAGFPALQADEPARARFRRAMREGIDGLAVSPLPSLALIEGPCF